MATQLDELLGDRPGRHLGQLRLLLVAAALTGLAIAGYLLFLSGGGSAAGETQTATVQKGSVVTNVSLSGAVTAQSTAELTFGESGVVTAVHVTVGQEVKAGDLLAQLESTSAQNSVRQAELGLQAAQIRLNELLKGSSVAQKAQADQAVSQAQSALDAANDALQKLRDGPTLEDRQKAEQAVLNAQAGVLQAQQARANIADGSLTPAKLAADAAIQSAQITLQLAQTELATLYNPDPVARAAAERAVVSAEAGLVAATANRDETLAGATQSEIDLQRNSVALSQLALESARESLTRTQLVAPFDGTIADLSVQVGDTAGTAVAITMNTPNELTIEVTVGDSDYQDVKVGQTGFATVDSLDGASFPVEIVSIGTLPTSSQGVVTYKARARILSGPQVTQGAPGGSVTPDSAAPRAGAPNAAEAAAKPIPGMQAQVTLIGEQKLDVLTLPVSAVQRAGTASTVQVMQADGAVETVSVTTGLSNGRVIEIVEGLEEGQTVVLPSASTSSSGGDDSQPGIIGGGPFGGGGRGGGGNFVVPGGGGQ